MGICMLASLIVRRGDNLRTRNTKNTRKHNAHSCSALVRIMLLS